jgi:hypothetical protein
MRDKEETTIIFCVNYGFIAGFNHIVVQCTLDKFVQNFKSFGLLMNEKKTETITLTRSKTVHQISDDAYNRKIIGEKLTSQQKQQ